MHHWHCTDITLCAAGKTCGQTVRVNLDVKLVVTMAQGSGKKLALKQLLNRSEDAKFFH